jgi:DNA replication protein DnaC
MKTIEAVVAQALTEDRSTIPMITADWNFNFQTCGDPALERALNASKRFVSDVENRRQPRWLTLVGNSGTGKTHLSKSIYSHWKNIGARTTNARSSNGLIYTGDLVVWPRLSDEIKDGKFWKVQELCDVAFAVIDELGADYDPSGMIVSKLDRILNERLGKWTVITSNMSVADMAQKLDTRIASRLRRGGGEVVEILTKDFNLRTSTTGK